MKEWILRGSVVIGLVLAALILNRRDTPLVLPETPTDAVQEFFDAAGRGESQVYLQLTRGELRKSLEYQASQAGPDTFNENLRKSMQGVKGLSIEETEVGPDSALVKATIVFALRNEVQIVRLVREDQGWAISAIEQAVMETPPVAYGTPVFGAPPSGPVPGSPQDVSE